MGAAHQCPWENRGEPKVEVRDKKRKTRGRARRAGGFSPALGQESRAGARPPLLRTQPARGVSEARPAGGWVGLVVIIISALVCVRGIIAKAFSAPVLVEGDGWAGSIKYKVKEKP